MDVSSSTEVRLHRLTHSTHSTTRRSITTTTPPSNQSSTQPLDSLDALPSSLFSLLSSLFSRCCSCLRSHFAPATSSFASAHRIRSQKKCTGSRIGVAEPPDDWEPQLQSPIALLTCHIPLRVSQTRTFPGKNARAHAGGGWPSHQTIGSRSCMSTPHMVPFRTASMP